VEVTCSSVVISRSDRVLPGLLNELLRCARFH